MSIDMAVREYLEKQKELYFNLEEYIGKLTAMKKKVQKRDVICLDHDKYKTKVIKLTAKPGKDRAKLEEAEKKFEEYKESYRQINMELIEEIKALYSSRFRDFKAEYQLLVSGQIELFAAASEAYKTLLGESASDLFPVKRPKSSQHNEGSDILPTKSPSPPKKDVTDTPPTRPPPTSVVADTPPSRPPPVPKKDDSNAQTLPISPNID